MTTRYRRRRRGDLSPACLVVSAASLVVHSAFFLIYFGGKVQAGGDTPVYAELSRGFFAGHGMTIDGVPSATYPPVYPAFFSALSPGERPGTLLATVQLVASASTAGAVYSIARRRFGRRPALISGAAAVAAPQLPFWAGYALSDSLGTSLGVWGLWACATTSSLVRREGGPDLRTVSLGALGGLLVALSILARPLNAPALVLAAGGLLATRAVGDESSKGGGLRRRRSRGIAAVTAVSLVALALPIGVWTYRNAAVMGTPIPLSTRTGWQLWQGVLWDLEGRGTVGKDVYYPEEAAGMGEVEADGYLIRRSIGEIRAAPRQYVSKFGTKVAYLWLPTAPGLGPGMLLSGLYFCAVAAMSAVALGSRRLRGAAVPFWLGAMGITAAVGVTILDPEYRYRLLLLALMLIPAGAGFDLFLSKIRRLYSCRVERGGRNDGHPVGDDS